MVAAGEARFERACLLVFAAAMCDLLDGRLARLLGATSSFGRELDSLSDVISFGMAPALLIFLAVLRPLGGVGVACALVYLLCGALRLARYNVESDPLSHVTFKGLAIPLAAGYILSFVMCRERLPVALAAAGTLAVAALMVSTVKIPNFRRGGLPVYMMVVGIAAFGALLAHPTAITWHLWNGWNLVLLGANYVMLSRRGDLHGRREARQIPGAA
jgi:CDP-diacylglycerol--serine O-phosphatidyltransferase